MIVDNSGLAFLLSGIARTERDQANLSPIARGEKAGAAPGATASEQLDILRRGLIKAQPYAY
jgi:hypothetical protein